MTNAGLKPVEGALAAEKQELQIVRIRIAECALPLPRILRLGPIEIKTRDYVVLRIETRSGLFGEAIAYPRGTPLFETVSRMARRVMGADASQRRGIVLGLEQSNAPGRAGLTRGLSLIDIACWDIACKKAAQPLFEFLGAFRKQAGATAVAGYYMDQRPLSDVLDEIKRLSDEGCPRVKIMLKGDDPDFDRHYVSAAAAALPGRMAADAHWTWSTLTEAKRLCRDLDDLGLNFLEDPFAASDWRLTHELQWDLRTPIAAGEDVYGARAFADLVRGIGILRMDATTCGGISGAIEAINIAASAGRTVLPHVFAPLHVHFACAFPNVEGVEIIPEASGADPVQRLLRDFPVRRNGQLSASEEPGVGITLDWDAIEHLAQRTAVISPEE